MSKDERRKHPRASHRQIAQVGQDSAEASHQQGVMGSTADLSEGGLRFEAQEGFAVGSSIVLSFTISERIVEAKGQVVHFASNDDGSVSMGISFTNLSDADQMFIEKYCRIRSRLE